MRAMDKNYKPLLGERQQQRASGRLVDPTSDDNVNWSGHPSVEVFNVEPSDNSSATKTSTTHHTASLEQRAMVADNKKDHSDVMKDLLQTAASKSLQQQPPQSPQSPSTKHVEGKKGTPRKKVSRTPERQGKKKITLSKEKSDTKVTKSSEVTSGSAASRKKKKPTAPSSPPASPTIRTPRKHTKRREDVLLTSVHLKDHGEDSERSDMSEITNPVALAKQLQQQKQQGSNIGKVVPIHEPTIMEAPQTPTEDLTENSFSLHTTSPDAVTAKLLVQQAVPPVPDLNASFTNLVPLTEPEVFCVALPPGPSGLSFKGSQQPLISSVKETSPLAGIILPGLRVVAIHLPHNARTFTNLGAKDLRQTLRDSARQAMRLLWLIRTSSSSSSSSSSTDQHHRQEDFSESTMATMSYEWKTNHRPHMVALTATKALISLPPTDLGMTLLGDDPPLIYSLSESSPLRDDVVPRTLYVLAVYCAETGDQWEGLDAHHLAETLRSTARQHGRVLVVTAERSPVAASVHPHVPEQEKDEKTKESQTSNGAPSQKHAPPDPGDSTQTPPVNRSVRSVDTIPKPPTKHILVKSGYETTRGIFGRSKTKIISFHGLAMDEKLAQAVQYHFDNIRLSHNTSLRPVLERRGPDQGLPFAFAAAMNGKFDKNHQDDALVAIMDAMASLGWSLNLSYSDSRSQIYSGGDCEKFVFTKP